MEREIRMSRTKLQSICINGYKSFAYSANEQCISFGDVTVVIGANGSGKSNLVSFFKLLQMLTADALQEYVGRQGFANNLLHFGAKVTPQMSALLTFNDNTDNESYGFTLAHAGVDDLIFTREYIKWQTIADNRPHEAVLKSGRNESALLAEANSESPSGKVAGLIHSVLRSFQVYQFHDTSPTSRIRGQAYIGNDSSLYSDGGNLAPYLRALKITPGNRKYFDRIVRYISDIMPQFGSFVLDPAMANPDYVSLNWRGQGEHEYIFTPQQLSDGSLRFMALAALLLQPSDRLPGVIVIDEPELGLHPSAIQTLAGMVKMASAHCQVILATQSPQLVDCFDPADVLVVDVDSTTKSTQCRRLDEEKLADWLHDYSLSELWEKNVLGGQP